jgi:hypothetical protein
MGQIPKQQKRSITMKKILAIILAALMLTAAFTACDSNEPDDTTPDTTVATEAPTEAPTEEPTEAPTEEVTTEAPTEEPEVTIPDETQPEEGGEDVEVPYTPEVLPIGFCGDKQLEGYHASGKFNFADGDAYSEEENNMFIVTNDTMKAGIITATFTATAGDINDNGIIFGMQKDVYEQYYFWEDGPAYYFLFVSDICHLYLAKASFDGQAWTELMVTSAPIPGYQHGDEVTLMVEFDGEGGIDCYANEEWLIGYYDWDFIEDGVRYGIRCEVPGVSYTEFKAEHTD